MECSDRINFVRFGVARPMPAPVPIAEQITKEDAMEAKQAPRPDDTPRRKKCKKCGELKPMDAFYKNKQTSDGREGSCKQCKTAMEKQRKRKNVKTQDGFRNPYKGAIRYKGRDWRAPELDGIKGPVGIAHDPRRNVLLVYTVDGQKICEARPVAKSDPVETPAAELREAFDDMIVRCKTRAAVEAVESGPQSKGAAQDGPERSKVAQYVSLGTRVGMLVSQKQKAYGDSFGRSGAVLRQLFPDGVPPERFDDLLCIVRILDKLFRVATDKTAFGENPYLDIAGYGLLGAGRDADAWRKALDGVQAAYHLAAGGDHADE